VTDEILPNIHARISVKQREQITHRYLRGKTNDIEIDRKENSSKSNYHPEKSFFYQCGKFLAVHLSPCYMNFLLPGSSPTADYATQPIYVTRIYESIPSHKLMRKLAPSLLRHRDPFKALECYNGLLKTRTKDDLGYFLIKIIKRRFLSTRLPKYVN
jgi:hypothetical protein